MNLMQNRKKYLKYFEPINVVLGLFILVASLFILNIMELNQKIKSYNKYSNVLAKIKILDNDFNNFIYSKTTFSNFDELTSKSLNMTNNLEILKNDEFYNTFNRDLEPYIIDLNKKIDSKLESIERYKSLNASTIGSVSYILSLSKRVKENYLKESMEDALRLDSTINLLIRLLINEENENIDLIKDNLKEFNNISLKYNLQEINYLNIRLDSVLLNLYKMNNIKNEIFDLKIQDNLELLDTKLEEQNSKNVLKQQKLSLLFFISASILLARFIYIYLKSLKTRNELVAFKYAVENSYNSIVLTDKNRKIEYVNEAFEKATGYTKKEALGKNPSILKSGRLPKEFYNNMNEILNRGEKWIGEFINKNKQGDIYYETASISPIIIDDDLKGYLAIKLDVTDYVKEKQKVEFLAYHDSLTMLPNRRAMQKDIQLLIEKSFEENKKLAVLFIDLDGFKFINDGLGHDIGDKLLKDIAFRLKELMQTNANVYRIGGDEFSIILNFINLDEVDLYAKNIIKKVNGKFIINNHSLHVGCSIGISIYPSDSIEFTDLMKYADTAMYKAKQNGKNRFEYYTKELSSKVSKRFEIEQEFKNALKQNEFYLVYQPKYSLSTHKIYSVEVLLRWQSSSLGNINPAVFIPIAEEMGFIYELGLFVFRKACEDFKELKDSLGVKLITINISALQLVQDDFIKSIKDILKETNVEAKDIGIELTETSIAKSIEEIVEVLKKLKDLGFKILIDDFGTGYSSLQYLQRLPIDIIKIDKSFVDNLNSNDVGIIKSVVAISKSFNYKTIAEGIETKAQEDSLLKLGVDMGQGYLFSKPKKLIEFKTN